MLVASQMQMGQLAIIAAIKAERENVRSLLLAGAEHGLEPGQTIQFGGETYRVTSAGPAIGQVMIEQLPRLTVQVEPRGAPAFGSNRPYLKKKKGRS